MGASIALRLLGKAARFCRDRSGLGAVEFALVAPFLMLLYLGGSQISMALTVNRKIHHVASTVNDLVTQSQRLTASELNGIFNVSQAIITPYDASPLGIKVTSVRIDASGDQRVEWSCRLGDMPASAEGSTFVLPASFSKLRNRYIVVAETRYDYEPVAGYFATGTIPMGGISYLNPRSGDMVELTDRNGCH